MGAFWHTFDPTTILRSSVSRPAESPHARALSWCIRRYRQRRSASAPSLAMIDRRRKSAKATSLLNLRLSPPILALSERVMGERADDDEPVEPACTPSTWPMASYTASILQLVGGLMGTAYACAIKALLEGCGPHAVHDLDTARSPQWPDAQRQGSYRPTPLRRRLCSGGGIHADSTVHGCAAATGLVTALKLHAAQCTHAVACNAIGSTAISRLCYERLDCRPSQWR